MSLRRPISSKSQQPREARYTSHALVELKQYRYLPLNIKSAILLDLSLNGFKAELTEESYLDTGSVFWLNIPLHPLGIYGKTSLQCKAECRWFDSKSFRLGGVFTQLSKNESDIIDQIINTLKAPRSS